MIKLKDFIRESGYETLSDMEALLVGRVVAYFEGGVVGVIKRVGQLGVRGQYTIHTKVLGEIGRGRRCSVDASGVHHSLIYNSMYLVKDQSQPIEKPGEEVAVRFNGTSWGGFMTDASYQWHVVSE